MMKASLDKEETIHTHTTAQNLKLTHNMIYLYTLPIRYGSSKYSQPLLFFMLLFKRSYY